MRVKRLYFVARIKPWHGGAWRTPTGKIKNITYIQAVNNIDNMSCDALHPICKYFAHNQKEAKRQFLTEQKLIKYVHNQNLTKNK